MDKFKFRIFDVFSYALPGLMIILCFYIYNYNFKETVVLTIGTAFDSLSNIKFNSVLLILTGAFIIGNVLHVFGYVYFDVIGKRLWRKLLKGKEKRLSGMEDKYVLIRQFSIENYAYIELWHAYRAMSFNLSLSFLVLGATIIFKVCLNAYFHFDWIMTFILCSGSAVVLLRKAVSYHIWSYDIMEESVKVLKLNDKVNEANAGKSE